MKDRGIIFNGENIISILEDRKTKTRRVIKPQPWYIDPAMKEFYKWECGDGKEYYTIECPYGQPGSKLWVKETFAEIIHGETAMYRADLDKYSETIQWRSPIFMPRWASRITLEIINIRVERIQDISEADAFAEGISGGDWLGDPVGEYKKFWNSINEKRGFGWETNCWVWILEFKRIKP
jgi:hypothetical protein